LQYDLHQIQPFPLLAAMIRLGHKYEALHIRDAAVASLQAEYPQNLTDWSEGDSYCRIADTFGPGLEFDVFNLAQEHRLLTVLPSMYLEIIFGHALVECHIISSHWIS
jgi:hypothetical protein